MKINAGISKIKTLAIPYITQLKLPYISSRSIKQYDHFGKFFEVSYKVNHMLTYGPAILLTQEKWKKCAQKLLWKCSTSLNNSFKVEIIQLDAYRRIDKHIMIFLSNGY